MKTFADLGVPDALVERLEHEGIVEAFPIQAATLPDSLQGRDVLGRGQTGSGKTLAFALALINTLLEAPSPRESLSPRALILLPTRELAQQVADVIAPLAKVTRLRISTVYGGVGYGPQINALRNGVDIVIACPGRLEDLIENGQCRLDAVQVTVLDEADHMADLGFLPAVKRLLDLTPEGGQRLLFSATLDNGVDQIVRKYLNNPVTHAVDPKDSDMPVMEHHLFSVSGGDKAEVVRQLVSGNGRTVAFTRTKHGAKNLTRRLNESGIPSVELHGDLSQAVRTKNLAKFSGGRVRVLVATDVAARGIHVDDVALVLHVDPPAEHKAYVHRSGRTARAGATGIVVTLSTPQQHGSVKSLMKLAGIKAVMRPVKPGHEAIEQITGPRAELIHTPIVDEPVARNRSSRERESRDRRPPSRGASRPSRDGARPVRSERSERPVRSERSERPVRSERSERPVRSERSERPVRSERSDRPVRSERSDRPVRSERSDRPVRSERSDRPVRSERSDRPTRTQRDDSASPRTRGPKKSPHAGSAPKAKKPHRKGASSRVTAAGDRDEARPVRAAGAKPSRSKKTGVASSARTKSTSSRSSGPKAGAKKAARPKSRAAKRPTRAH
ncbi:MAG: DEAD/DEAH box helicase [Actinobacteria bacterium]|nr:DEAD/DEAH box helicase [Actinomycetota bacterium]